MCGGGASEEVDFGIKADNNDDNSTLFVWTSIINHKANNIDRMACPKIFLLLILLAVFGTTLARPGYFGGYGYGGYGGYGGLYGYGGYGFGSPFYGYGYRYPFYGYGYGYGYPYFGLGYGYGFYR